MKTTKKESLNIRGFKLIYKLCPKFIISQVVKNIFLGIEPFIPVYFSALIIGELSSNRNINKIWFYVLITLIVTFTVNLISSLLTRVNNYYKNVLSDKSGGIKTEKINSMDFADVDKQETHALLSRIRQIENQGGYGLYKIQVVFEWLILDIIKIITAVGLSVSLFLNPVPKTSQLYFLNSPLFSFAILLLMFIVCIVCAKMQGKIGEFFMKANEGNYLVNRIFGYIFDISYNNNNEAFDIRTYDMKDKVGFSVSNAGNAFGGKNSYLAKSLKGKLGGIFAFNSGCPTAFIGVIYIYVCLKCYAGAFDIGLATRYISSVTILFSAFNDLLSRLSDIKANEEYMKPIFEFLDIPNKMYMGSITTEKRNDCKYELEFRDVSFKYPGSDIYALKNLSFKFNIGEKLAIVGQNGSGKTTFIKLLCRLYDPTEGEILLNKINIQKYNYDDYMNIFSVVFQDFKLLPMTLGENVAASDDYDSEKVIKCLTDAGFKDRLNELPNGLDTYLYKTFDKDGVSISGGEAQKIAIARALYRSSPFVILDEPTAALDPIAESEIYSKFDSLVHDKTAVYISHRLSSCRFCEKIAVFDKGKVVQCGSHDELLADENGKYYELWNAQAKYYK